MSLRNLLVENNYSANLKVKSVDVDNNGEFEVGTIKVDDIQELTANSHVGVERLVTREPLQEFNSYSSTIASTNVSTKLINFTELNVGDVASGYLNNSDIVAGTFTIQENGFYATSLDIVWQSSFTTTNETYYFKCVNITEPNRDGVQVQMIPQNYQAMGEAPETSASEITYLEAGDVLEILHYRQGGTSTPTWAVEFTIYRLK